MSDKHQFIDSGLTSGNTGIPRCAVCGGSERLSVHKSEKYQQIGLPPLSERACRAMNQRDDYYLAYSERLDAALKALRERDEAQGALIAANEECESTSRHVVQLEAELAAANRHIELLQEKIDARDCACAFEKPDDICAVHCSALTAANRRADEAEQLKDMWVDRANKLEARVRRLETFRD